MSRRTSLGDFSSVRASVEQVVDERSVRPWVGLILAMFALGMLRKVACSIPASPEPEVIRVEGSVVPPAPLAPAEVDPSAEAARLAARMGELGVAPQVYKLADRPGGTIFYVQVPGVDALKSWRSLRSASTTTGRYPVILGAGRGLNNALSWSQLAKSPADILRESAAFDQEAWLQTHVKRQPPPGTLEPMEASTERPLRVTVTATETDEKVLEKVAVALVPATTSWEAAAWLGIGADGACGWQPVVHVGLLRRWFERHGAELVAVDTHDLELVLAKPVANVGDAWGLAEEQRAYAAFNGGQELVEHARLLRASTRWSFFFVN
jgi:hypothetical protein